MYKVQSSVFSDVLRRIRVHITEGTRRPLPSSAKSPFTAAPRRTSYPSKKFAKSEQLCRFFVILCRHDLSPLQK